MTCGMTTGAELKINGQGLFGRQRSILGSFMGGKGELLEVFRLVGQGKLHAVIDSAFPLQEAAAAQRRWRAGNSSARFYFTREFGRPWNRLALGRAGGAAGEIKRRRFDFSSSSRPGRPIDGARKCASPLPPRAPLKHRRKLLPA